jgi:hypothetical protein
MRATCSRAPRTDAAPERRRQMMGGRRVAAAAWPSDLADGAVAGDHGTAESLPACGAVAGIPRWSRIAPQSTGPASVAARSATCWRSSGWVERGRVITRAERGARGGQAVREPVGYERVRARPCLDESLKSDLSPGDGARPRLALMDNGFSAAALRTRGKEACNGSGTRRTRSTSRQPRAPAPDHPGGDRRRLGGAHRLGSCRSAAGAAGYAARMRAGRLTRKPRRPERADRTAL